MTAQRLLKLLTVVALATGLTAFYQWHANGFVPDTWLIRASAGALLAALLVGLTGRETRPRVVLRFLSGVAALVAVIALVADFTRAGTGFTSLNSHLSQLAPSVLAAMRSGVTQTLGAAAWDHWIAALLATPTFAVFSLIGAVCAYAARKRHKIRVFIN
ncbi:MAG TPA: hypothetical protein PKD49_05895 [Hyphomicrobium sp.]|nr:hypothetical protein [Hyphomicrobium sp.]